MEDGEDLLAPTQVPSTYTNYSLPVGSGQLEHGVTYTSVVVPYNKAGLSVELRSDGVIVDLTPPDINQRIVRVLGANSSTDQLYYTPHRQALTAAWAEGDGGFQDLESGIASYEWTICSVLPVSVSGDVDGDGVSGDETEPTPRRAIDCPLDWTVVGRNTSSFASGLHLVAGRGYHVGVRAQNNVGLVSDVAWSPLVTIDISEPYPGTVLALGKDQDLFDVEDDIVLSPVPPSLMDGTVPNIYETGSVKYYQQENREVVAEWYGFVDQQSGITDYSVCIGRVPGSQDIQACRSVGLVQSANMTLDVTLNHGDVIHVSVLATNYVGLSSFGSSPGTCVFGWVLPICLLTSRAAHSCSLCSHHCGRHTAEDWQRNGGGLPIGAPWVLQPGFRRDRGALGWCWRQGV